MPKKKKRKKEKTNRNTYIGKPFSCQLLDPCVAKNSAKSSNNNPFRILLSSRTADYAMI
jgi:hypothetical protein